MIYVKQKPMHVQFPWLLKWDTLIWNVVNNKFSYRPNWLMQSVEANFKCSTDKHLLHE